ncbi:MAG: HigA family addiction module antitoxin [Bradyrhizobium sp.]
MAKKLAPMHPGEVLRKELLVPLGLSAGALAKACGVPRTRTERIANEKTAITADTALRLGKALGTSAQLWLNLQNEFDMRTAKSQIGKELDKIAPVTRQAASRQLSSAEVKGVIAGLGPSNA